jgi:hypothetical protein
MSKPKISNLLLERYNIGDVTNNERVIVEKALAEDDALAASLSDLKRADAEFFKQFSKERFFPENAHQIKIYRLPPVSKPVLGLCAAAMLLLISLPVLLLRNSFMSEHEERIKGASAKSNSIELNIYVMGNTAGEAVKLENNARIHEGNIIQLAYFTDKNDTNEKYGIIFSIDGRNHVTLHYPYNQRQDTVLITGKDIPLEEAFRLDDAPKYEIFFFIAGISPLNVSNILDIAEALALQIDGKINEAEGLATAAFNEYELEIFTLLKE